MCAQTLCTHSYPFSAPAITGNDNRLTGYGEICTADNAIPYRLSCAISVIKQEFALGIIYRKHREKELIFIGQLTQAVYTGSGFF